jgi:hypothetical protein
MRVHDLGIALPLHPEMIRDEVDEVCSSAGEVLDEVRGAT